jgi:hypothetical protein
MATQKNSSFRKTKARVASKKRSSRSAAKPALKPMKEMRDMGHNVVSSIKSVLPASLKGTTSRRRTASSARGRKSAIAPFRAARSSKSSSRTPRARRAA